MHSQRFRSLMLSFALLTFAGYTLTSVRDTPLFSSADYTTPPNSEAGAVARGGLGDGDGGASQMSWKPSSWNVPSWAGSALRGAGVGGGSRQENVKALGYVGDKLDTLDGWQNASLRGWQQSDDITIPSYDPETDYLPPTGAYTGGVVWLTRRSKLRDTLASLESLARYMPMEQAYSFIFMHSGDLASHLVQTSVRARWDERAAEVADAGEVDLADKMREMGKGIEFLEINMDAPESVARKGRDGLGDVVFANVWPGYHSMCRFFAVNIFWNHRIRQLDYYMRMDTDSYLLTPMSRDPFRRIQSTGQSYAYRHYGGDPEFVVSGMADYIESWVSDASHAAALDLAGESDAALGGAGRVQERIATSKMIESSRGYRKGGMGAYYNNWELVHVASFRKPGVREWLESLGMHDEGFYKYRWGDAPLRYATVQMFFEPEQYEHYCDFNYYHQFLMKEGTLISENPPLWKC